MMKWQERIILVVPDGIVKSRRIQYEMNTWKKTNISSQGMKKKTNAEMWNQTE